MMRIRRKRFTNAEKRELWQRWRKGESVSEIARALQRNEGSVNNIVVRHGGFPPRERTRHPRSLSLREREQISRGLSAGQSMRQIARALGRSPSTVSREVERNGGVRRYRAVDADRRAWRAACRPKTCKLRRNKRLCRVVAKKLSREWSPEQISGWLVETYPDDSDMQVSHETIYRSLFIQSRGALKKELIRHLRRRRATRRARTATGKGKRQGKIVDAVSIRERPAEAEDRAIPGHWEGDLIAGTQGGAYLITLVERQTRFVLLEKVTSKQTDVIVRALIKLARKIPDELRRSVTWDRGGEMASHKKFTVATGMSVFFCDPASPWQRGSNENTNGLLRQYFPKGKTLDHVTQRDLNHAMQRLNTRPRKTLGFKTPAHMLDQLLR